MFLHWVDLASTNQIKYSLRIYRHSIANTIKFSLTIPNRQTDSHGFICSVWSVFVLISVKHFVLVHSMREDFAHYFMNYELVALGVREIEWAQRMVQRNERKSELDSVVLQFMLAARIHESCSFVVIISYFIGPGIESPVFLTTGRLN